MALTDLHLNSLISAVGTPGFENVLVDEMRRVVGVDHCAIFCGDKQGSALSVSITAGKISDSLAQDCAELYTHKLFHKDPLIGWGKLDNTALMPPQINRIGVDDLTDADYRDILYKRCKILEKLTLFHGSGENQYCLNLYRLNDRGPFSSREM